MFTMFVAGEQQPQQESNKINLLYYEYIMGGENMV